MTQTNDELRQVYIKSIKIEGDLLYPNGTSPADWFPEKPVSLNISFEDFDDPEDYRTVLRLLTLASRKQASKLSKV